MICQSYNLTTVLGTLKVEPLPYPITLIVNSSVWDINYQGIIIGIYIIIQIEKTRFASLADMQ